MPYILINSFSISLKFSRTTKYFYLTTSLHQILELKSSRLTKLYIVKHLNTRLSVKTILLCYMSETNATNTKLYN